MAIPQNMGTNCVVPPKVWGYNTCCPKIRGLNVYDHKIRDLSV